jgi:queuine tRNA-ribosyltransferase
MNAKNHNSTFTYQNGRGYGRIGQLKTRAGVVQTPTFMPDATRGAVKGLQPVQVYATGVQIVLNNTYHLHLQPGEAIVKKLGGVHHFGKWTGPILTDSGGFQVFSLDKFTKVTEDGVAFKDPVNGDKRLITPEKSMQIQFDLGSDMFVAFDHLIGLDDATPAQVLDAFERTHRWLERCITEFKRLTHALPSDERPLIFGVVQGGLDKELRKRSLELVLASEVDGIAIGGLSVGEPREDMHDMLEYLAPLYGDDPRPRFLLGVGDPIDLRKAIDCGIDMLDCVLPTRNARHATVWVTGDQKIHLTNSRFIDDPGPIEEGCDCATCQAGYSKGFLRHLFKAGDPLAGSLASVHNLRYLTRICEEYQYENSKGSIA